MLLVAGFPTDRIRLQCPGTADFVCRFLAIRPELIDKPGARDCWLHATRPTRYSSSLESGTAAPAVPHLLPDGMAIDFLRERCPVIISTCGQR
jgi:hypothetical protein